MSVRLFLLLLQQSLERLFSYRVNFWLQFWGSALTELAVAYLLWSSVFESQAQTQFGGFTFQQMMVYYLLISFVGRVIRGRENFEISSDIYEGSLTRYLLYPHNYFLFKLADHAAFMLLGALQSVVAFTLAFLLFSDGLSLLQFDWGYFPFVLSTLLMAGVFYFLLMTLLELVAFWADNIWSLLVMARFTIAFFGGFYLPLSLFPNFLQKALFFTPFPALTYVPVQFLLGQSTPADLIQSQFVLLVWTAALVSVVAIVWSRGQYKFSGVGQ